MINKLFIINDCFSILYVINLKFNFKLIPLFLYNFYMYLLLFTFVKVNFLNTLYTMVNNKEFTIRLQKILSFYSLSAAAFAEKMGIGRSSISHIISGRNKPSLEFVLHILDTFEDVTFEWLIYGKGTFPKTEVTPSPLSTIEKNKTNVTNGQQDIFSNTNVNTDTILQNEVTNENIINTPNTTLQKSPIDRIVIFYINGSFSEYKN